VSGSAFFCLVIGGFAGERYRISNMVRRLQTVEIFLADVRRSLLWSDPQYSMDKYAKVDYSLVVSFSVDHTRGERRK